MSTVAINLLWLVPGTVGGSEESTVSSVRGLVDLAPSDLDVRLVVARAFADAYPDVVGALPTRVVPGVGGSRLRRVAAETSWARRAFRGADLVHHAGGTAPVGGRRPYVLTLHDLQPLQPDEDRIHEGGATHGRIKRAYLQAMVPRSVQGARTVVVPSGFVRDTVLDATDLDPARVVTVHHGVEAAAAATPVDEVSQRYGLDGPVVLYPAITYPHKDHATLVEAFARVLVDHPTALLVLTGRGDAAEADLRQRIDRLGIVGRVRRTDRIPAADLAGLYGLASVVAVPSRYEGFGLPAMEAMAHGAPVVAAAATALPEVVGDAGLLVPPGDVEAWAEAVGALLGDPVRRQALAEAGRARAAGFGRRANAAALVDVYRRALA